MPGINDDPGQVREIVRRAREAGARNVTPISLHLRPGVREVFTDWLEESRPDLVGRYKELYARGSYLATDERRRQSELVRPARRPGTRAERFGRAGTAERAAAVADQPAVQPRLF
jgi:DNA repair photolyase